MVAAASQCYAALRPLLQLGDLVLFEGRGALSEGIKFGTRSRWSHIGMVVCDAAHDVVLCWESTTLSNLPDAGGQYLKGVQLVSLSQRIESYDGDMAIRPLVGARDAALVAGFRAARAAFAGRPYEARLLNLALAEYDGPGGRAPRDLSSLFCSELVGATYQAMGLLPAACNPGEWVPRDFSSDGVRYPTDWVEPHLTAGYQLEPEVLVDRSTPGARGLGPVVPVTRTT